MTVGTFVQPAFGSQTGTAYKTNIDNSIAALARIAAAFAPHEQDTPDMTVRVDAGSLFLADLTLVEHAAQDTGAITAPSTQPRIDRVVIDQSTGAVTVVTGEEAAVPAAPAIPAGKFPVCQVALETTTTAIDNTMLTDERTAMVAPPATPEGYQIGDIFTTTNIYANSAAVAAALGYGTWELAITPELYPLAQNGTYVQATNPASGSYLGYFATDPAKSLTGSDANNAFLSGNLTEIRFHIALAVPAIVKRVHYENAHDSGANTDMGLKNFTLWGSNDPAAFAEMTYGTDTGWTQLTTDISQLVQHVAADQADPHYIEVTNLLPYLYYAFKFADNWGDGAYAGLRRLVLGAGIYQWLRTA